MCMTHNITTNTSNVVNKHFMEWLRIINRIPCIGHHETISDCPVCLFSVMHQLNCVLGLSWNPYNKNSANLISVIYCLYWFSSFLSSFETAWCTEYCKICREGCVRVWLGCDIHFIDVHTSCSQSSCNGVSSRKLYKYFWLTNLGMLDTGSVLRCDHSVNIRYFH